MLDKKEVLRYCKLAKEDMHNQWTENEINLRFNTLKQSEGKQTPVEAEKTAETITKQTESREKLQTLIGIVELIENDFKEEDKKTQRGEQKND